MEKRKNGSSDNNTLATILIGLGILWLVASTGILDLVFGLFFGAIGAVFGVLGGLIGLVFGTIGTVIGLVMGTFGTLMGLIFGSIMLWLPLLLIVIGIKLLSGKSRTEKRKNDYTIV